MDWDSTREARDMGETRPPEGQGDKDGMRCGTKVRRSLHSPEGMHRSPESPASRGDHRQLLSAAARGRTSWGDWEPSEPSLP